MGFDKTRHQDRQVIRLWTDEMYNLLLVGNCLPDVILAFPIITVFESRVNNPVLKLDQPFLLTEVLFFCKLKGCKPTRRRLYISSVQSLMTCRS
jgi:hypothetical protein